MATVGKLGLLVVALAIASQACGQTARKAPGATLPALANGGEGGNADLPQAGSSGSATAAGIGGGGSSSAGGDGSPSIGGAEGACVAFCNARQIHIQHCREHDGGRGLNESFERCFQSNQDVEFGLCATDASCGGWLGGCLSDASDSVTLEAFLPSTTCAESVKAGLFAPSR